MSTKDKETGQETAEAGTSNQDVPIIEEPAASPSTSAKIYPSIPIVEMVDDDDDNAESKSGDEEWQMIGASGAVAGASGSTSSTPAEAATAVKGAWCLILNVVVAVCLSLFLLFLAYLISIVYPLLLLFSVVTLIFIMSNFFVKPHNKFHKKFCYLPIDSSAGAVPKRRTPSPERNDLPPHVAKSLAQVSLTTK